MDKILWVDLEMTGLDPEIAVIIEFAGVITNLQLEPLDQYHAIVYQPEDKMALMNDWVRTTHGKSGLLAKIPEGKPLDQVEREVLAFLRPHFGDERPVLAGNSIHQDRKFIDKYMVDLSEYLHYRMIDVSSFKQIFRYMYGVHLDKASPHRATDDILASIDELKYYLTFITPPTKGAEP